jgi:proteasome lid subunit RPN8/RPN11
MTEMRINKKVIEEMYKHSLQEYPDECCGIVTGNEHSQVTHFCENIQNRLHAGDPERHPRDARTAYVIDREEAEKIIASAKEQGKGVIAFYHSHVNHEAYFSVTDVEAQTVFGEPEFPDALHIVISVINKKIHDIKCFQWDREKQNFKSLEKQEYLREQ